MSQLLQYAANHALLVGATVLLLAVALVFEFRERTQSFASISATEAVRLMNQGALLIDIRGKAEFDAGHIAGARNLPGTAIADGAKGLEKYRDKPVIAYCDTGMTAGSAARHLTRLGFKQALNLRGGLAAWRQENLPVVKS